MDRTSGNWWLEKELAKESGQDVARRMEERTSIFPLEKEIADYFFGAGATDAVQRQYVIASGSEYLIYFMEGAVLRRKRVYMSSDNSCALNIDSDGWWWGDKLSEEEAATTLRPWQESKKT